MSRRETKTQVVDKSAEKKKRDELIASIAVETGVRDDLKKEIKALSEEYAKAKEEMTAFEAKIDFWKKATADAERVFLEWETKAKAMHQAIADAEIRIKELNREESTAKANLSRVQVESAGEMAQIHNQVEAEKQRIDANFVVLMNENTQLEQRVNVLKSTENSIIDEITTKRAEVINLDGAITKGKSILSQINMDIESARAAYRQSQKQITTIDVQLDALKAELTIKDKEIADKTAALQVQENEMNQKKEQLVALAVRENRINELAPAIEELYRKAGLSVKI